MDAELWAAIRRLFEIEKLSQSAIAARLRLHRQTVRQALASPEGPPPDRRHGISRGRLEPYKSYLQSRLKEYPELSGAKLMIEIQKMGYPGGYTVLKDYLQTLRPKKREAFLRLETLPGEYAQVDWANVGRVLIGNAQRPVSCFVMVLSFSRMMYLEFTLSQCLEDFMAAHVNAFRFFGGLPKKINYDNLKTVVLSRVGKDIRFHSRFMDFAGYYLFEAVPCNVRAAWEKGKVESAIKYIRSAFLAGRPLVNVSRLNEEGRIWLDTQANVRLHGGTHERPIDRFAVEAAQLQNLPAKDYDCSIVCSAHVNKQAFVHFQANRYSVPAAHVEKVLTLKATTQTVGFYDGPKLLASHLRCYEKYRVIEDPAHFAQLLAERKKAAQTKLIETFLNLDPECRDYLKGLNAVEFHLPAQLQKIQDLVRLYGPAEVISAVRHALKFQAFGAHYLQNIILQRRAAKNLPPPQNVYLLKKPQWNQVTVEPTDLSLYDDLFAQPDLPFPPPEEKRKP
jgi:transposase